MKTVDATAARVSLLQPAPGRGDFVARLQSTPLPVLERQLQTLTPQERVVLDLIVKGDCNKEICRVLGIEITTAKAHTSRIFKKLAVKNRVQAAVFGLWARLLLAAGERADVQPSSAMHDQQPQLAQ